MRKFNQLILIIISVISVTLLLIYRHEYNRLRYVLEVFNFFGKPNQCRTLDSLNNTNLIQHDWGPTPVWQVIDSSYVYSAFQTSDTEIQTLVVDYNEIKIQSCYLWYEHKTAPLTGNFNFHKLKKLGSEKQSIYEFHCHTTENHITPYSVSFSLKGKETTELKKIMIKKTMKRPLDSTVICVVPSNAYSELYSKKRVVEFLSFYKIIGVDTFIIYNNNIPHHILNTLDNFGDQLGIHVTSYPWNYPGLESDATREIAELDCLLRTQGQSKNVIVLDWTEYIVPRFHHSLPSLLDNYSPDGQIWSFDLKTMDFCITRKENNVPTILQNFVYNAEKPGDSRYVYRRSGESKNIQEISMDIVAVHRYITCPSHSAKTQNNNFVLKFSKDFNNSVLMKLFQYKF